MVHFPKKILQHCYAARICIQKNESKVGAVDQQGKLTRERNQLISKPVPVFANLYMNTETQ